MIRILLASLIVFSISCSDQSGEETVFTPSYASISEKTIVPKCVRCHQSFESYKEVRKFISAGNAANSKFYTVIEEGEMPQNGAKIVGREREVIAEWINKGAKLD